MSAFSITHKTYSVQDFRPLLVRPVRATLSHEVQNSIRESHRRFLALRSTGKRIYGVTTGFGDLSRVSITPEEQVQLQYNLVRSHAAGVGDPLDAGLTRIVMLLKLITFGQGASGVRLEMAQQIQQFLNHDILPVIPRKGSVGASGDLAPLAHMALALIGEGDVHFQDRIVPGIIAMKEVGLEPLTLEPKEGLSLLNGTQVSTALGIKALLEAEDLLHLADVAGALSVEASLSTRNIFRTSIHKLKQHPGQQASARNLWKLLEASEIVKSHKQCDRVQDPYSMRCIPHVHGASREMVAFVKSVVENEINSVSDNPLILKNGEVHSSGHFHAESVAQAMDALAITMSEIGAIAERRIHFFMKGISDKIPPFVAYNPGLESGCMLAHVSAAALASENKTLAHPASVDSIPTSAGQEDFVSMAPWAGRKVLRILDNVTHILAVEFLVAAQSTLEFHSNLKPGKYTQPILDYLHREIKFSNGDHPIHNDINILVDMIRSGRLLTLVHKHTNLE